MLQLLLFLVASLCAGCGASGQVQPEAPPVEDLPPYTDEQARIFDDSLAPEVFGLEVDRRPFLEERAFVTRAQLADHVLRAKLLTVNTDRFEGQTSYRLTLRPIGSRIAGEKVWGETLELKVRQGSPSLSLLRSMETEVVGRTLVVLIRRYRVRGEMVLHFRGEPDAPKTIEAVKAARAKAEEQ